MKRLIIFASLLCLTNCHHPNPIEELNKPPYEPDYVFPPADTTSININLYLQWKGGDPDADDNLKYDVYLGPSKQNLPKIASNITGNTYRVESLQFLRIYYWKIIAKDTKGNETSSKTWTFITRQEFNQRPYIPSNPMPISGANNSDINNVRVQWEGGDPDDFSVVDYKIYVGTTSPPNTLLISEHSNISYYLPLLDYDTKYFWRIIAEDNYDSVSVGPIWDFATKAAVSCFSENFDNNPVGVLPHDSLWVYYGNYGSVYVTDEVSYNNSGKSCKFRDFADQDSSIIATTLSENDIAVGKLEFAWRVDGNDDYIGMRLYSGLPVDSDHIGPQISIRGDSLQYFKENEDYSQTWNFITLIQPTVWYKIKLVFDCYNKYYNIYVNDELKINKATWIGTEVNSLKYLYFLTFNNRTCSGAYIDEIKFSTGE